MKDIILSIKEVDEPNFEGFKIITSGKDISIAIDNSQQCCECWGYMSSDDDLSYYVGAEILSISTVEEGEGYGRVKKRVDEETYRFQGIIEFVEINTSKGVFAIAVYNDHNGYYSHEVKIKIGDEENGTYI